MEPYGDPVQLLAEWFSWWLRTDSAPPKMRDALHVRTAMALQSRDLIGPDDLEPKGLTPDVMLDEVLGAVVDLRCRVDEQMVLVEDGHTADHLPAMIDAFGPVEPVGMDDPIYTHDDQDCILNWPHDGPCVHEDDEG